MRADFGRRFEGKSLLYLCIEVEILASVLKPEQCMGYLEPSAVEIILQERKLVREAERAVGGEQVLEGGRCRNTKRNLAGGGGYSGRRPIRENYLSPNSQGHPSLPPRPEFSNSSNARSTGRPNGARSGYPTRGSGAPIEAHVNQDPNENHTSHQIRNPRWDSCTQNRTRPGQGPPRTWVYSRDENPPSQNTGCLQTHRGRPPGLTLIGVAAPVSCSSAQEIPLQAPRHYWTGGKVNKNGSQKRRERNAREKLSLY